MFWIELPPPPPMQESNLKVQVNFNVSSRIVTWWYVKEEEKIMKAES